MSKKDRYRQYIPRSRADYPTVYADELHVDYNYPSPVAMIYRSEMDYISRCILDYPDIETGGQLFGFWTGEGVPVVLYAIGPGPRANHQHSFFNQDVPYLQTVGQTIIDTFGLQHIGEWHSHHSLGLDHPSGHDANTMISSIQNLNLHRFLLCIGNYWSGLTTLNAYTFHENRLYDYEHAAWNIVECDSPYRNPIDCALHSVLVHPETARARLAKNYIVVPRPTAIKPVYDHDYWLREKENNRQLKEIVDFIAALTGKTPAVRLDENGHVTVTSAPDAKGECLDVYFPEMFPLEAPEIYLPESLRVTPPLLPDGMEMPAPMASDFWQTEGEIATRVITCIKQLQGIIPPPLFEDEDDFVEEAPVEEAPVEEAPAEEAPVEEAPVEVAPVEEAPAEEAPVEVAPVEEAPVEEIDEKNQ